MTDGHAGTTGGVEVEPSDWRLSLGLGVTGVWLALGFLYIANVVGWLDFARQPAPELGGFLEGAFAPLAFPCSIPGSSTSPAGQMVGCSTARWRRSRASIAATRSPSTGPASLRSTARS